MNEKSAVKKFFKERQKFVVLGLTGRTGSGCSTVAKILEESNFKSLKLRTPKDHDYQNADEIKYSIIHKYISNIYKENIQLFKIINVRDVIASFVFSDGYDSLASFLKSLGKNDNSISDCFKEFREEIENISKVIKTIDFDKENYNNKKDKEENYDKINEIYFELVPAVMTKVNAALRKHKILVDKKQCDLYTHLFQIFGNNLRCSGDPFKEDSETSDFFVLAERINIIIKAIRAINKKNEKKPTFICIDAIRNPYEASFFKDRYSAFYLMAISTDEISRKKRLSHLSLDEINHIDKIEYPKKLDNGKKFYHQDIAACLQLADIHIYNREENAKDYYFLTEQIMKYAALIFHPGLVTPTSIERCMQIAYNAKLNSGCLSRQVGAVVTGEDYSVKSVGWNDVPKGQVPCNLRDCQEYLNNKDYELYSNYEITDEDFEKSIKQVSNKINYPDLMGLKYPYCFKDVYNGITGKDNQVHTRALHAEENAFLQIAKYGGIGIKDGFLFTTASPCELCSKKAYQLGIKKIYYIDPYPGISQSHILKFGDFNNPEMHLFYGAIGNAYISLYMPKMPFKDELEMLTGKKTREIVDNWRKTKENQSFEDSVCPKNWKEWLDIIGQLYKK